MKRAQLFLMHFAGGNAYSFASMASSLNEFDIIPLELPGRGKRSKEPLLKEFDLAAFDLYRQISERLTSGRFMIYGHSMGAYLTVKVSAMLEKERKYPHCLFVSGNPGPGVGKRTCTYRMEQSEFIEELKKIGGISAEALANKELIDYYEPILRADFEIVEKNEIELDRVNAPLFAMMGDEEADVEKISNWARFSAGQFNFKILSGGHFFIFNHPVEISSIIKGHYDSLTLQ